MALNSLEAGALHRQKRVNKVLYIRVFQILLRRGGIHPVRGKSESEILLEGIFLMGEVNLRRSDFDNLNFFQS